MNLGAHYALLEDARGLEYLRSASRLAPQDGEIRFNLGIVLAAGGEFEEAVRELKVAGKQGVKNAMEMVKQIEEQLLQKDNDKMRRDTADGEEREGGKE